MQILLRAKFDETEKVDTNYMFLMIRKCHISRFKLQSGIRRLINEGTFLASFPLHEGRYDHPHTSGATFDRRVIPRALSSCS